MKVSPVVFRQIGCRFAGIVDNGSWTDWHRRKWVSLFGIAPLNCSNIWSDIVIPQGGNPKHLLWALAFLRSYENETSFARSCGCEPKTARKWVWKFVEALAAISEYIVWKKRFVGNVRNNVCLVSVDGTDFRINEPSPFDPKWFSHKFKGPGLRYEVAVSIQRGWIVWVNGPYPCGSYPDLRIAREALIHELEDWEYYIADGGYQDGGNYAVTPSGRNEFSDRQKAVVRARHETVNKRLKDWSALSHTFRHSLDKHGVVFRAIANLVQLQMQTVCGNWALEYDESEF